MTGHDFVLIDALYCLRNALRLHVVFMHGSWRKKFVVSLVTFIYISTDFVILKRSDRTTVICSGQKSNANVGEIYKYINQHTISTLHICDQYRSWTPDQMLSSETDIASMNPTLAISRANRFNRIGN